MNIVILFIVGNYINFYSDCCADWMINLSRYSTSCGDLPWFIKQALPQVLLTKCHIVGKNVGNETNTFRVSFSAAERVFFSIMPYTAKLVYLAAKTIFYNYVKDEDLYGFHNRDSKEVTTLPSYVIKTTMFYFMLTKSKTFWEQEKSDTLLQQLLSEIYNMLYRSLQAESLPNFFVPGINLLDCIELTGDACNRMKELVLAIARDPSKYYPANYIVCRLEHLTDLHQVRRILKHPENSNKNSNFQLLRNAVITPTLCGIGEKQI